MWLEGFFSWALATPCSEVLDFSVTVRWSILASQSWCRVSSASGGNCRVMIASKRSVDNGHGSQFSELPCAWAQFNMSSASLENFLHRGKSILFNVTTAFKTRVGTPVSQEVNCSQQSCGLCRQLQGYILILGLKITFMPIFTHIRTEGINPIGEKRLQIFRRITSLRRILEHDSIYSSCNTLENLVPTKLII